MPYLTTRYDSLPVGAVFSVMRKVKDPDDRRRRIYQRKYFTKARTHGTVAGFALCGIFKNQEQMQLADNRRNDGRQQHEQFLNSYPVQINADDLYLTCCALQNDVERQARNV